MGGSGTRRELVEVIVFLTKVLAVAVVAVAKGEDAVLVGHVVV